MLFKCLPPGAEIPGRFPGPARARGKWFTIDIHCHVLTPKAAEIVAGHKAVPEDSPAVEQLAEHTIAGPQMVDPDRGIYQDHS